MAGKFALIIGNSRYDDSSLGRLKAPELDVQELEGVLKAPDVGHFDEVTTLLNEGCASVRKAIARFYDQRQRDDLLLLYFSGHGVKDEQGHLYLALRDTESGLLAGTAIETAFISGRMDRSFSKSQVLVLDCCHSGAFAHGTKAAQGVSVGTAEAFEGTGLGRVILTATDSTQYAWEGDQIIGDAPNSLFTHFLIEGLKTGAADRDDDGAVTVDELYDYVREQVVNSTPRQTPHKWAYRQEGEIVLAQNPFAKRSALPPEIEEGIGSKLSSLRLEAVRDLGILLRGHHLGRARAALAALRNLSTDDSRKVANAAADILKSHDDAPVDVIAAESHAGADDRVDAHPPDIFVSYAHEDREKAKALANVLGARGWKVWWDRKIAPGEAFDVVIERQLRTCKCAIVLWSARSVGATWVRNEARRAARRKVLVPILIDTVETPLEFENLQAADLTSWEAAVENPEFEAVLDRIQALSPIPDERLARAAVEDAHLEFVTGHRQAAIAKLEQFRPAHVLVSRALAELRAEAERIERERAEAVRREAAAAEAERIERERAEAVRREADAAEAAQQRRRELAAAQARQEAIARNAAAARAEAERIEHERAAAARREADAAEAAQRRRDFETDRLRTEAPAVHGESSVDEAPLVAPPVDADAAETPRPAFSWLTSRPLQVAAVLLALLAGTWIAVVRPGRAPRGPGDRSERPLQNAVGPATAPAPAPTPRTPVVETAGASPRVEPLPSTPIEGVQPTPGPVPASSVPKQPAELPAGRQPSSSTRLEELRTRARSQARSGQAAQALSAVVEGLQIDPRDPGLRNIQDSLLREAQAKAVRSRQSAENLDANARAEETFERGLQAAKQAIALRRAGKIDAATRAFWVAADEFGAAAVESQKAADAEDAEQARRAAEQARVKAKENERPEAPGRQRPNANGQTARNAPDTTIEQELVNQTLRRYEAAYASLKADSVRSVYPSAPLDQLATDFAGYRSYTMKIEVDDYLFVSTAAQTSAVVKARIVHDVVTRSGQRTRSERPQTFQLEKQRNIWIIDQIR